MRQALTNTAWGGFLGLAAVALTLVPSGGRPLVPSAALYLRNMVAPLAATSSRTRPLSVHPNTVTEVWVDADHLRIKYAGAWQDVPLMPLASHAILPKKPWFRSAKPKSSRRAPPLRPPAGVRTGTCNALRGTC